MTTVIFSTPCGLTEIPPTQAIFEVSKMSIESRPMTTAEVTEGKDKITKMIDAIKSAFKTGSAFVDAYNLIGAVTAVIGVGDLISGITKFLPDPDNPIIASLQVLEDEIKHLGEILSNGFDDLKAFMSELKFFLKVISPTSVLTKLMRDSMKHPGQESLQNFKKAYQERSPLSLIYTLISYLEQESTNPIKLAMESGSDKKLHPILAFRKWDRIIRQLMGQLLLLEAFASGLIGSKSQFNCEQLIKESKGIISMLEDLNRSCEDLNYWEEVKAWLTEYIPTHTHRNNFEKLDEIQRKMEEYRTSDAFFIAVFNEGTLDVDYTFHCPNSDTQLIGVWNKGKCNAFIYRSIQANYSPQSDFDDVARDVKLCKYGILVGEYKTMIKEKLLDTCAVRGDGFVWIADSYRGVYFNHANCPGREPGCSGNVVKDLMPNHISATLIVGLP